MSTIGIKEETEERLHLHRDPTIRSWAVFVGIIALGFGAAYYSADYLLWKVAYISGAIFLGLTCMEDWEECLLDKTTKKVTLKRQSLIQKLFQITEGPKIVLADLDDVTSVQVQEEEVKYAGVGYMVVLHFGAGYSLGVTETVTVGEHGEQEVLAEKIRTFLHLEDDPDTAKDLLGEPASASEEHQKKSPVSAYTLTPSDEESTTNIEAAAAAATGVDDYSSSDDSFEQIDKADLVDEIVEENMGVIAPETVTGARDAIVDDGEE